MMKLILSLSLIWMVSITAAALQCLFDGGKSNDVFLHPCDSDEELCATAALHGFEENLEVLVTRSCVPSSLCTAHDQILSFSTGSLTLNASVHCCNTDGCNNQTLPFPMQANKNDLQCLTCTNDQDTVCNGTVQCVGIQDRCITVNGQVDFNDTFLIRGCASANVCEVLSHLKVRSAFAANFVNISSAPKCCGTSFCNSAWTGVFVLCCLVSFP